MQPGSAVKFTRGPLGLIREDTPSGSFEPETVKAGDTGTYVGPHPYQDLADHDWHMIDVGNDLTCPCHSSQFEVVT